MRAAASASPSAGRRSSRCTITADSTRRRSRHRCHCTPASMPSCPFERQDCEVDACSISAVGVGSRTCTATPSTPPTGFACASPLMYSHGARWCTQEMECISMHIQVRPGQLLVVHEYDGASTAVGLLTRRLQHLRAARTYTPTAMGRYNQMPYSKRCDSNAENVLHSR
jgi:hypothetical protein